MKLYKSAILLVLMSVLILPGCDKGGSQSKSKAPSQSEPQYVPIDLNGKDVYEVDEFYFSDDFYDEKEIHTAAQKEYLSYKGDYSTIDPSLYPDGMQHLSDPLAVTLEWTYDLIDEDRDFKGYSVIFGQEEDLSDGYELKGSKQSKINIYNSYLGTNYFRVVARYADDYIECSPIYSYDVDATAPRNLKIDGMTNCRDMGGRRTVDGGMIKQGLIYRTSAPKSWGNGRAVVPDTLTDAGKEELLNHLGVKTEIDVNNSGSNNVPVENYQGCYMYYDSGIHHLYRNTEPLKKVFHILSDKNNYPVFYHCRIGTDRTGLCAIMISSLLGLPENEIYKDYLFSNFGNIQEKRYIGERAGRDNIQVYMEALKTFPGEKLQNKVYNFLLSIGIPAAELDSIIDILTEGTKATGNKNNQLVVTGEGFTASGSTRNTSSDQKHPAVYYTLGAGQSVTATFNVTEARDYTVIAYFGSTNTSESLKMNQSVSAQVDGSAITVPSTSFHDMGFGTSDNGRTYYSPLMIQVKAFTAGSHTVTISGLANNLNIGAIALI